MRLPSAATQVAWAGPYWEWLCSLHDTWQHLLETDMGCSLNILNSLKGGLFRGVYRRGNVI